MQISTRISASRVALEGEIIATIRHLPTGRCTLSTCLRTEWPWRADDGGETALETRLLRLSEFSADPHFRVLYSLSLNNMEKWGSGVKIDDGNFYVRNSWYTFSKIFRVFCVYNDYFVRYRR